MAVWYFDFRKKLSSDWGTPHSRGAYQEEYVPNLSTFLSANNNKAWKPRALSVRSGILRGLLNTKQRRLCPRTKAVQESLTHLVPKKTDVLFIRVEKALYSVYSDMY